MTLHQHAFFKICYQDTKHTLNKVCINHIIWASFLTDYVLSRLALYICLLTVRYDLASLGRGQSKIQYTSQ